MTGYIFPSKENFTFAYQKERDREDPASELCDYLADAYAAHFTVVRDSLEFMGVNAVSANSTCFRFATEDDGKPCANLRLFGKVLQGSSNDAGASGEAPRAFLLEKVGYPIDVPIVRPVKNGGRDVVLYRYADEAEKPVVHFLALEVEAAGCVGERFEELVREYDHLQRRIGDILVASLQSGDAPPCAKERFHELFYRRLVDKPGDAAFGGRVRSFYLGKTVLLPDGSAIPFGVEGMKEKNLWDMSWRINGRRYPFTLRRILERSKDILNPEKIAPVYVTAHGDDHIANMRYVSTAPAGCKILCFDPEFAGLRIPALMAMTKSLCNSALIHPHIFLHPEKYAGDDVFEMTGDTISIDFDDAPTPLRRNFMQSQLLNAWAPLVNAMQSRGVLPENWEAVSRSALCCCLLLARNLISEDRMLCRTSLVSLAMVVMCASAPLEGEDAVSGFFKHIKNNLD